MEIEKEGLHTYGVRRAVDNKYFINVEYPVICYNHPESLLPILLREQDGESIILYDITNGRSMLDYAESREFSLLDSKRFLECFRVLLRDIEELMLNLEHVNFLPECIYFTGEQSVQWMYCPDEKNELSKNVQHFFAWMLSEIDYGDSDTVRFVYHTYWLIRNKSLSEQLIQECLDYETSEEKSATPYEAFFGKEENQKNNSDNDNDVIKGQNCVREEENNRERFPKEEPGKRESFQKGFSKEEPRMRESSREGLSKHKSFKRGLFLASEIALIIFSCFDIIAIIFLITTIFSREMTSIRIRYLAGCLIFLVMAVDGVYQLHRKRKNRVDEDQKESKIQTRSFRDDYDAGYSTALRHDAEADEGTVRLDLDVSSRQAFLRNENTGEVCVIYDFPFYIGNETGLNHLSIPDKTVSRQHAVIHRGRERGTYTIKDLQSTNGTWVNHNRIGQEPVNLQPGSHLYIAKNAYSFNET